jgi:hypothetical protein
VTITDKKSETEVILPTGRRTSKIKDPRIFLMYSLPKAGKTTLVNSLDNNLILDLEEGADYVDSMSVKIIGWDPPKNEDKKKKEQRLNEEKLYYLTEVGQRIMQLNRPYDFITVDTISQLEEVIKPLALKRYRETPMGRNFDGEDVLTLDRGAGYYYMRIAYREALDKIKKLANNIILIGHLKDTVLTKNGKEVSAKDIDLTGKLKQITCADADAIGYLYRGDNSETIINFKGSDEVLCGARCPQLKGKEIKIADYDPELEDLVNIRWDIIYPDKFNNK